ncbi:MAG TPA: HD domain-containing phosphohydrolase [Longimicrobiaceae bacterium]|nr:HD domain-containing phosphohydrolase [Longimicrobiaceae bacterium]
MVDKLPLPTDPISANDTAPAHVLVVDDEESIRLILSRALGDSYRLSLAASGEDALRVLEADAPDAILSDLLMPGINGTELLRRARERDPAVGFVILSGLSGVEQAMEAPSPRADDYIEKPFSLQRVRFAVTRSLERRRLLQENAAYRRMAEERPQERDGDALLELCLDALWTVASAIEIRDGYAAGHLERLARQALAVGAELGVDADQLERLWLAGVLHDIGKLGVPERILSKPGPLTRDEYELVKRHPETGARILDRSERLRAAAPIVRHHHERWNGKGYPDGLHGEEIPLEARILAVVDSFNAMVADRPYRPRRAAEVAAAELQRGAGTVFDPQVVAAFARARAAGLPGASFARELLERGEPRRSA